MPRLIPIPQRQLEQQPQLEIRQAEKPRLPAPVSRAANRPAEPRRIDVVVQTRVDEPNKSTETASEVVEAVVWPEYLRQKVAFLQQTFEKSRRTLDSRFKATEKTNDAVSRDDIFQFSVQLSRQFQQFASFQR